MHSFCNEAIALLSKNPFLDKFLLGYASIWEKGRVFPDVTYWDLQS